MVFERNIIYSLFDPYSIYFRMAVSFEGLEGPEDLAPNPGSSSSSLDTWGSWHIGFAWMSPAYQCPQTRSSAEAELRLGSQGLHRPGLKVQ